MKELGGNDRCQKLANAAEEVIIRWALVCASDGNLGGCGVPEALQTLNLTLNAFSDQELNMSEVKGVDAVINSIGDAIHELENMRDGYQAELDDIESESGEESDEATEEAKKIETLDDTIADLESANTLLDHLKGLL